MTSVLFTLGRFPRVYFEFASDELTAESEKFTAEVRQLVAEIAALGDETAALAAALF